MKLQLDSVTKIVGAETHLYDMSLTLNPGLNVLLGPTLAGKTSLMRLMAGLDKPTTGRILEDGEDITHRRVQKRNTAFVYQQFINYPSLSVFENIASPLRVRGGLKRAEIKKRVEAVAEMMQIAPMLKRLPAELSGGQQQRTAIARALVKESNLLLLDEPLVNLDYKLREELRAEMQNIFATRDATVVYATTEPLEALMLGGTTFVFDEGRLHQAGPTLDLYHQPKSERVARIFSDPPMNLLPATIQKGQVEVAHRFTVDLPPHMQALASGSYQIGVRPSHLTLAPSTETDIAISAQVVLAEINGSETFMHVGHQQAAKADTPMVALISGVHPHEPGQGVTLHLNPQRLYAFEPTGQTVATPHRPTTNHGKDAA